MHGNDDPGLDLMHQFRSLFPIDCVMSAHRDQAHIQVFQLLDLLLLQFAPQVSEMCDTETPIIYDISSFEAKPAQTQIL